MRLSPSERTEQLVGVCVAVVFTLACLGVVSSLYWYFSAQEVEVLKSKVAAQALTINYLNCELADQRHKIDQANRLLAVAYPAAKMDFLSED